MAASGLPPEDDPPPETLDELYEHAPCGYLTARANGIIVRVNQTLLDLLQTTRDALIGKPIQAILTPGGRLFYETYCAPMLNLNGVLSEISIDLACANGSRLPALLNWRRVESAEGRILGYRVMIITAVERLAYEQELLAERERARQQEAMVRELNADLERRVEARTADLVQAQKMESLGHLTGGVAHDFNNLLTPILISLDLLHRRYLTDDRALRMATSAISAAERARVLIARLLAFARRQHLRPQSVDLGGLATGMTDVLTGAIGSLVTMRIEIPADLPPALVDRSQLETALLNLCINARDAMPDGGALAIGADEVIVKAESNDDLLPGRYVRLAVSDTGSGMTPEILRRAAEPFYSTKTVGKGTGLGLSMVYGLAAQSGGRLVLESTPGHGTTATVWLPVDQSSAPARQAVAVTVPSASKASLSILLVDDDELVRFAAGEMLADLGHTIVQAASGVEALDALRQHAAIDVLITDYLMPGMTGVELARIARHARPNLPVLLVTGYANINDVDSGGLNRLAKPFGTNDLSNAIAQALSTRLMSAT